MFLATGRANESRLWRANRRVRQPQASGAGRIAAGIPLGMDGCSGLGQKGDCLASTRFELVAARFVWRRSEHGRTKCDPIALRLHGANQREPSAQNDGLVSARALPVDGHARG